MLLYCPLFTDTRLNPFKVLRDFVTKVDLVQLWIDSRKFSHLFDNSDIIL